MSDEGFGAYDPSAPEGSEPSRSQYVSKKDVRIVLVGVILLAIAAYPIYKMLERNAQRSVCATNLGAIAKAISQYAEVHDERFPPIMRTGPNLEPDLGTSGYPYTWASDISEIMSPRSSFKCPAAQNEEITTIEGREKIIQSSYGMYAPYGGYLRTLVPNPDQTVLIAETTNFGALATYDPTPFKTIDGQTVKFDGFVIGWNNTNNDPDDKSDKVTRLAFPETSGGVFRKDGPMRHDGGIHALNCSGAMLGHLLKPTDAIVPIRRGLPGGIWEAPPASAAR
jgi:hypothetical protein